MLDRNGYFFFVVLYNFGVFVFFLCLLNVYFKLNLYYFVLGFFDFLKRIDSIVCEFYFYDVCFMIGVFIEDKKKIF